MTVQGSEAKAEADALAATLQSTEQKAGQEHNHLVELHRRLTERLELREEELQHKQQELAEVRRVQMVEGQQKVAS